MCCFTGRVEHVANTRIFAGPDGGPRQFLVYQMHYRAGAELAMVLPLPTPRGSPEDALRFIDLSGYGGFFADMHRAWPMPAPTPQAGGNLRGRAKAADALVVVEVGSYEASFVPTVADFERLDERFRLPAGTWERLGDYRAWGFAVFKLKAGAKEVHPMAFSFPRAWPDRLFFPTVHVHDGAVHRSARFDHTLYLQAQEGVDLRGWSESDRHLGQVMRIDAAKGIVRADAHAYRREFRGELTNVDTWIAPRGG